MVFLTCVIIVLILYYLQADGLIYVTIIAVMAELINIFLSQTMSKAVEKKTTKKFAKIINSYKAKIETQKKTIKELENIQEESIKKLHNANLKIKEFKEQAETDTPAPGPGPETAPEMAFDETDDDLSFLDDDGLGDPEDGNKKKGSSLDDLPAGSNRKGLSV